jgi:hypothetical protein
MKRVFWLALVAGVVVVCNANAAASRFTPSEIERAAFLSLALDPDYVKSKLGVRILGQEFPGDDAICDVIAERLLKEPPAPADRAAFDAYQWYVVIIRDKCSGRYHDTLTTVRERVTNEKLLKHVDVALAAPVDFTVPQYKEGGVDLLDKQIDVMQMLGTLPNASASARGTPEGTTFGEVLERAGFPQELTQMNFRIARYGRSNAMVANYRNGGMLIFRRDFTRNRWVVGEALEELGPVSEKYQGANFGVAQAVASLRGTMFRGYIKGNARKIRADPGILWALADRLTRVPFPSDRYEEDGMLLGIKLIVLSRHPDSLEMLQQIGAAPGDDIPAEARAYARKVEKNQALPAAEPEEPADAEDADEPAPAEEKKK